MQLARLARSCLQDASHQRSSVLHLLEGRWPPWGVTDTTSTSGHLHGDQPACVPSTHLWAGPCNFHRLAWPDLQGVAHRWSSALPLLEGRWPAWGHGQGDIHLGGPEQRSECMVASHTPWGSPMQQGRRVQHVCKGCQATPNGLWHCAGGLMAWACLGARSRRRPCRRACRVDGCLPYTRGQPHAAGQAFGTYLQGLSSGPKWALALVGGRWPA